MLFITELQIKDLKHSHFISFHHAENNWKIFLKFFLESYHQQIQSVSMQEVIFHTVCLLICCFDFEMVLL